MADDRRDEKETEKHNLHKQANNNNLVAYFVEVKRSSRLDASAARLQSEGDNITDDEYLGHPLVWDEGEVLGAKRTEEPAEDHVDRGSVERWGDEDEDFLDYEAAESILVEMAP